MLPPNEQQYMRYQVAQNIKKLQNHQHDQNALMLTKTKHKLKIVKQIREKLINNNVIVVKADKGNSIVVMIMNKRS
jgi:hypothetical protein